MPITSPVLDDRSYEQILAEALARIPVHNPEWTNFNESDPGVTLLQLFAFMTDSLLYRANLIPERSRRKFLELLGLPMRAAAAAHGVVTIANERGPLATVTLPAGLAVAAGSVGYVTTNALDVLPLEARAFYRGAVPAGAERDRAERIYRQLYGATGGDAGGLDYYRTVAFDAPLAGAAPAALDLSRDAVDRTLWLALLLRAADGTDEATRAAVAAAVAGRTLTLGLAPAQDADHLVLPPGGAAPRADTALAFDVSTGRMDGDAPRYAALETAGEAVAPGEVALVQLTLPPAGGFGRWDALDPLEDGVGDLPPALEDEALAARVLCWVRVRALDAGTADGGAGLSTRLGWVGINAARITQRIPVPAQRLADGTGAPDQRVALPVTPVIEDSVELSVAGERWTRTDDLLAAPPEVPARGASAGAAADARVFHVDRESGAVRFGDGLRGARPPAGAAILATYAAGGGAAGNVGAGAVKASTQLPAGFRVANPLPTRGGDDGETVADAERRMPLVLRHRERAVSAEDYRELAGQTPGVAIGRVEVLPAFHPEAGAPAPGVVTLLLVPDDPLRPDAPVPDLAFLNAVCRHLEPRRLVTTELHLRGPAYVPLLLTAGFDAVAGADVAAVREAIRAELRAFLSPLHGGQDGSGWPLARPVEERELWARVARVDGVAAVRGVRMFGAGGVEIATLPLSGLELPRVDGLSVRAGDPEPTPPGAAASPPAAVKRVPVPVLPAAC